MANYMGRVSKLSFVVPNITKNGEFCKVPEVIKVCEL